MFISKFIGNFRAQMMKFFSELNVLVFFMQLKDDLSRTTDALEEERRRRALRAGTVKQFSIFLREDTNVLIVFLLCGRSTLYIIFAKNSMFIAFYYVGEKIENSLEKCIKLNNEVNLFTPFPASWNHNPVTIVIVWRHIGCRVTSLTFPSVFI